MYSVTGDLDGGRDGRVRTGQHKQGASSMMGLRSSFMGRLLHK